MAALAEGLRGVGPKAARRVAAAMEKAEERAAAARTATAVTAAVAWAEAVMAAVEAAREARAAVSQRCHDPASPNHHRDPA